MIDALRGVAILLMVWFHFCFDLALFGFAEFDFYTDPFWLHTRTVILTSFLLLVGISLMLSHQYGFSAKALARRLALIGGAALLVSVSTWWMFDQRWVFFGVLHFIALASLLAMPFLRFPGFSLVIGIVLLVIGNIIQHAWFDQIGWRWIGLMTTKPATEDYVPLLPWFGVVLLGIVLGKIWLSLPADAWVKNHVGDFLSKPLACLGRVSLLVYLLHQPVLIGVLTLLKP